jgi:DNA polymerase III gamma/tau subunit
LAHIAEAEGLTIDAEALGLIAEASHGGFRDAISLLDQVASNGQKKVDGPSVRRLLGWTETEQVTAIIEAVLQQQPSQVLEQLDRCFEQGAAGGRLIEQLIAQLRTRVRTAIGTPEPVQQPAELLPVLESLLNIAKSPLPELALEATLVKQALPQAAESAPLPKPQPAAVAKTVSQPTPKTVPAKSAEATDQPDQELWLKALSQIKQHNNSLYALLRSSCTVHFEANEVILGCRFSFHRDRIRESKNLQIIEQALARTYGRRLKAVPQLEATPTATQDIGPSDELVASALEILGGEVVE